MKQIALAGFMMTVEEWQALDAVSRAQLVAAVMHWEDSWPMPLPVETLPLLAEVVAA